MRTGYSESRRAMIEWLVVVVAGCVILLYKDNTSCC